MTAPQVETPFYWTGPSLGRCRRTGTLMERIAETLAAHLDTSLEKIPWIVVETCAVFERIEILMHSMEQLTRGSRLWVPTPADPDLPAFGSAVVPFVVGPAARLPLISGRMEEISLQNWQASQAAFLEVHSWMARPGDEAAPNFLRGILFPHKATLWLSDGITPLVAPLHKNPEYHCRWAKLYGVETP